eukprot:gene13953-16491_t
MSDSDEEPPDAVAIEPPVPKNASNTEWCAVPVTLVSGYLGAGKTTLVNYVLTEQHGRRIAVIVNEYGQDLGIEKAMVQDKGEALVEEFVELGNGCICCSVKHNFVATLEQLLQRRDKFDYVLIETTGLADPGPIAAVLWTDDELEAGVFLDSIVTVVDACNLKFQLRERREDNLATEAALQIAYADTILLNKKDLVSTEDLAALRGDISAINSSSEILVTERSRVDLAHILDRGTYRLRSGPPSAAHRITPTAIPLGEGALSAVHDSGIHTVSLLVSAEVMLEPVKCWLENLLWESTEAGPEVLRLKVTPYANGLMLETQVTPYAM